MVSFTSPTGDDSPSLSLPYPNPDDPIRTNTAIVEHAFRLISSHQHTYMQAVGTPVPAASGTASTGPVQYQNQNGSLRQLYDDTNKLASDLNTFMDQKVGVLKKVSLKQKEDTDSTISSNLELDQTVSYANHVLNNGGAGKRFRAFVGHTAPKDNADYEDPDFGKQKTEEGEDKMEPALEGPSINRWQIVKVKKIAQKITDKGDEPDSDE